MIYIILVYVLIGVLITNSHDPVLKEIFNTKDKTAKIAWELFRFYLTFFYPIYYTIVIISIVKEMKNAQKRLDVFRPIKGQRFNKSAKNKKIIRR